MGEPRGSNAVTTWCLTHPFRWASASGGLAGLYLGLQFRSLLVGVASGLGLGVVNLVLWWPTWPPAKAVARRRGIRLDPPDEPTAT